MCSADYHRMRLSLIDDLCSWIHPINVQNCWINVNAHNKNTRSSPCGRKRIWKTRTRKRVDAFIAYGGHWANYAMAVSVYMGMHWTSTLYIRRCKRRHGNHIFLYTNHRPRSHRVYKKKEKPNTVNVLCARILKQRIVSGLINLRPSFIFSFLLLRLLCSRIRQFLVLSLILFVACSSAIFEHYTKCGAHMHVAWLVSNRGVFLLHSCFEMSTIRTNGFGIDGKKGFRQSH